MGDTAASLDRSGELSEKFTAALNKLRPVLGTLPPAGQADTRLRPLMEYCNVLIEILEANARQPVSDRLGADLNASLLKDKTLTPPSGDEAPEAVRLFVIGVSALVLNRLKLTGGSFPYAKRFLVWAKQRAPAKKTTSASVAAATELVFDEICPELFDTTPRADDHFLSECLAILSELLRFFNYTRETAADRLDKELQSYLNPDPAKAPERLTGKLLLELRFLHDRLRGDKKTSKPGAALTSRVDDLLPVLAANDTLCRNLFEDWGWVTPLRDRERWDEVERRVFEKMERDHLFARWNRATAPAGLLQPVAGKSARPEGGKPASPPAPGEVVTFGD